MGSRVPPVSYHQLSDVFKCVHISENIQQIRKKPIGAPSDQRCRYSIDLPPNYQPTLGGFRQLDPGRLEFGSPTLCQAYHGTHLQTCPKMRPKFQKSVNPPLVSHCALLRIAMFAGRRPLSALWPVHCD